MSSELVKALKAWDAYEPNISEEKVLMQAIAVIDAARPLLARIEALEAENAELRNIADQAQRFKDAVSNCISDTYFSMNSDLATTDAILHVSLYEYFKARRAREGGNADG